MDLVFCPEGGSGVPLYQDPLIRWTAAATLDVILGPRGRPECAALFINVEILLRK